jgi:hypothetical protein
MSDPQLDPKSDPRLDPFLAAARRAVPAWNAGRQQQSKWAVMARLEERRRPPVLGVAITCGAVGAIALVAWRTIAPSGTAGVASSAGRSVETSTATPGTVPPAPLASRLADGSSVLLDGPSTILRKTSDASGEVVFELAAGGARFEVARRPSRTFRVHAGPVTVHVMGTGFRVQRQDGRSHVIVDHGRVLVSWWGGTRELGAGEEGVFPPSAEPSSASNWASKPASGKRARPAGNDGPDVLFARADRARIEGRPHMAVAHLREILERYPADPHAPMAAFTTGRLLLEALNKPGAAAVAFARARVMAKGSPLAEDALAREVQALHAAGDELSARHRAELYRALFPQGPRLQTVIRFGGLQAAP